MEWNWESTVAVVSAGITVISAIVAGATFKISIKHKRRSYFTKRLFEIYSELSKTITEQSNHKIEFDSNGQFTYNSALAQKLWRVEFFAKLGPMISINLLSSEVIHIYDGDSGKQINKLGVNYFYFGRKNKKNNRIAIHLIKILELGHYRHELVKDAKNVAELNKQIEDYNDAFIKIRVEIQNIIFETKKKTNFLSWLFCL